MPTLAKLKGSLIGTWVSIDTEVRPSTVRTDYGTIRPFYLTRAFKYYLDDQFELEMITFADPFGQSPISKIYLQGQVLWQGDHPLKPGVQKVQFIVDTEYSLTPLHQGYADTLTQTAGQIFDTWEVNKAQSVLRKPCPPLGLSAGQIFSEYDLIFLSNDFLFWGARHVDGTGFDTEENRPTNLQIPLIRPRPRKPNPIPLL